MYSQLILSDLLPNFDVDNFFLGSTKWNCPIHVCHIREYNWGFRIWEYIYSRTQWVENGIEDGLIGVLVEEDADGNGKWESEPHVENYNYSDNGVADYLDFE